MVKKVLWIILGLVVLFLIWFIRPTIFVNDEPIEHPPSWDGRP